MIYYSTGGLFKVCQDTVDPAFNDQLQFVVAVPEPILRECQSLRTLYFRAKQQNMHTDDHCD